MNNLFISKLPFFNKVIIPKYIELKIQNIALKHLELQDMGQLKDRMEGQLYYDKLKVDLLAEFAFEKIIGIKEFNWAKREYKFFKRKHYEFNGNILKIVTFQGSNLPKINQVSDSNSIFAYVNPDNRVYISGLATVTLLKDLKSAPGTKNSEFTNFDILKKYTSFEELMHLIE
jgi:hypothetical protein